MPGPALDMDSTGIRGLCHEDTPDANNIGSRGSEAKDHDTGLKTLMDADAGRPLPGQTETLWDKMMSQEDCGQPYSPFESKEEWELVYWLSTEGLSQGAINCFLKLRWVREPWFFVGSTKIKHLPFDTGPGSSSAPG